MPFIQKIELRGFKSFGPKAVTLTVNKGFTAVTGPNGSGKTNIVDAILFVLGELSARRMRAANLAKLIFHGSPEANVDKAKSARVLLRFDNRDGRIPVDTNTVAISREIFRNGQSIYRLNGRRVSRGNLHSMLSMAGIGASGHNIILQGTITRMTDISSSDRRKVIEGMVGIAQYDSQKAEAEEKLQAADVSIRTAMGRIDEVQRRVDDLERERNELLRFSFIQNEIKRFEAIKLSHSIAANDEQNTGLLSKSEEARSRLEEIGNLRNEAQNHRHSIEDKWRRLNSEMVEEGSSKVLEVQIKIGELKSRLAELGTKINAGKTTLESLLKVKENTIRQLDSMQSQIADNRKLMRRLKKQQVILSSELKIKQEEHERISSETSHLWENISGNAAEARKTQAQLDSLSDKLAELKIDHARRQTSIRLLSHQLNELHARRDRFEGTLSDLQKSYVDLKKIRDEQKKQLDNAEKSLERRHLQKTQVEKEIEEAGKIAGTARDAVVEFATQRELAESVAAEENALLNIEELGQIGVITGIHGRLKSLVKIEARYQKALEAAASGWLNSLVVQDIDVAFTCTETLRRLKLGRIKLIPIKGLKRNGRTARKNSLQVDGFANAFVKCPTDFEPAVDFVFGDTVVARNDQMALKASQQGVRSVTLEGDVYEAGGGFESGFFRAPVDFSTMIPSKNAMKSLDEAVIALQQHLTKREETLSFFDEDITETRKEITRLSEALASLDTELTRAHKSVKLTTRNIRKLKSLIKKLQVKLEAEKTDLGLQKGARRQTRSKMQTLRLNLAELKLKIDPTHIQELEVQRDGMAENLITIRQNLGSVETELSTYRSQHLNVLKPGNANVRIQLRKIQRQLKVVEHDVDHAMAEREQLKQELQSLETSREELSATVLGAREEAKKFASEIETLDKERRKLDREHERADRVHSQLQLSLQTLQLEQGNLWRQLREYGYENPLATSSRDVEEAETSLRMMKFELERLGAVNQLALSHYAEQMSRYKELSLRMNELEREKQSILAFMEEIEGKKRRVFMEAFEKMNQNLGKYFAKVTSGGQASLVLENPDEPFTGGIDMIVQFPNKPSILVTGASGGERSVSAVAFLFAIQEFTPAAFYVLDEVDAHLDGFHVAKLGELLAEEAESSQFIAITLKPEMVNKAERVYGVFERNGVSNVVSTTFRGRTH
ncbi:MAG: chromosome segregation protein SMC [Candidatus Bathyarchaeota archaeon]|nr:MAG: chromosome segregation protein SMC [Candidatus Bathyarchaeota archaeon]